MAAVSLRQSPKFDPARRYELTLKQSSGRIVVYGSPVDSSGRRWRIEDAGTVEMGVDAVHDDEEIVRATCSVQFEAEIQLADLAEPTTPKLHVKRMPPDERRSVEGRIRLWAKRPDSIAHKIMALVVNSPGGLVRTDLVAKVQKHTKSKNPYGAVASLMTSEGNAYGRALIDDDGIVTIHPDLHGEVSRHRWTV